MSLTSFLYRAARTANTADAVLNPRRAPRRAKNVLLGRALGRAGVWRRLWGGSLVVLVAAGMTAPAQAGQSFGESARPADWVGTVLAGGQLERPALCKRRGGVGHQRVYTMGGRQLERRGARGHAYWVSPLRNAVLDWHRGLRSYLSFARHPLLVAVWCERERAPNVGTVIIRPDGTPVVVNEDGSTSPLYPEGGGA